MARCAFGARNGFEGGASMRNTPALLMAGLVSAISVSALGPGPARLDV